MKIKKSAAVTIFISSLLLLILALGQASSSLAQGRSFEEEISAKLNQVLENQQKLLQEINLLKEAIGLIKTRC